MRKNHLAGIAMTLMLLASGAYGSSSQQHAVAAHGCTLAILDGSIKAYARKAGREPDHLPLEFKQNFIAKIKAEKPEIINAITGYCSCVINFIVKAEGGLDILDMEAVMKKHGQRMLHECPSPGF